MENYIMVNGVKTPITDGELETLARIHIIKSPSFERVPVGQVYYSISETGSVVEHTEIGDKNDDARYAAGNYSANKTLLENRAARETLYRLLWRFAAEHGSFEKDWTEEHDHTSVHYNHASRSYGYNTVICCEQLGGAYFNERGLARRAIDEIIKPFMTQHPYFMW